MIFRIYEWVAVYRSSFYTLKQISRPTTKNCQVRTKHFYEKEIFPLSDAKSMLSPSQEIVSQ